MAEYFDASVDLGERDIGRAKEMTTKIQKFRANLWLCDAFPLSLPEQIMPIVDLMAISSSHFAKLKNFIQMQLPSGFPIKIGAPQSQNPNRAEEMKKEHQIRIICHPNPLKLDPGII